MKIDKKLLKQINETRTVAHEILYFDPNTTLLFGKCETGDDECKTFPFKVPVEHDNVPLVFSRTFRGEIETYANGELIGSMSDDEHQYDGLGSSKIPAGDNLFVLLPNTLQYCVSSANMQLKVNGKNGMFLPPHSTKVFEDTDELYLAVYEGEVEAEGIVYSEDLIEPGNYKVVANNTDKEVYVAQIKVTQL